MTIDEYKDLMLEDEINIGCYVEEDDLPDELDEESWIDGLLTSGFHPIEDDELFGEPITGYSCLLYTSPSPRDLYRSRMPSSA